MPVDAARTFGWPYPFRQVPWDEIVVTYEEMAATAGHMADIARSVLTSGVAPLLAGTTSMLDLVVVPVPIPAPPYDRLVVRAPGSLDPPRPGYVRIEHLTSTNRNDSVERPVADAVPLFWRFVAEKYGVVAGR